MLDFREVPKLFVVLSILFTFLFSPFLWAEQISIKLGLGAVEITAPDTTKLPIDDLETEILISEDLARLVLQKKVLQKEVTLQPGPLEDLMDSILDQLEPEIEEFKDSERAEKNEMADGLEDDSVRVNVGSHEIVAADESLDEVVVLGGKLEVYGEIKRLVVMGGEVLLHSSALISEELVLLGGDLESQEGARIEGSNVQLNIPFAGKSFPFLWRNLIEKPWDEHFMSRSISVYWLLFQLMLFLLIAGIETKLAPLFKARVQAELDSSVFSSGFWGLFLSFMHMPIVLVLLISLIGIPLIPVYFSMVFIFYVVGCIHMAHFMANRLMKDSFPLFVILLAGILSLDIVPGVGFIAKTSLFLIGYGAVVKVFWRGIFSSKGSKVSA